VARALASTTTDQDGEHEHGAQEMEAKLMAVLVGSEEVRNSENAGSGRSSRRPWWTRPFTDVEARKSEDECLERHGLS
jgi:hypothetical protein